MVLEVEVVVVAVTEGSLILVGFADTVVEDDTTPITVAVTGCFDLDELEVRLP